MMSKKSEFVRLLQMAFSGEKAAAYAYAGHARSLRDKTEQLEIQRIECEELEHRQCVGQMLLQLSAAPQPVREFALACIGKSIAFLCRWGGWYVPMYGAGRLESANVGEYQQAAKLAYQCGYMQFVEDLLHMAEVEWDHEFYFREKCASHWLDRFFPSWRRPIAKENIRASFEEFVAQTQKSNNQDTGNRTPSDL